MAGYECGRFRSQPGASQADGSESAGFRAGHLFFAEVSIGTDKHEGVLAGLHYVFQQRLFAGIAMGDKLLSGEGLADERIESRHLIQLGQAGFERLLDGRYQDFVDALCLDDFSFRMPAIQESQFVKAYFGGFFGKPFRAVHVLGGCYGYVQVSFPQRFLRLNLEDVDEASFAYGRCYSGAVKIAFSIGQHNLIACLQAQYADGVCGFFFRVGRFDDKVLRSILVSHFEGLVHAGHNNELAVGQ